MSVRALVPLAFVCLLGCEALPPAAAPAPPPLPVAEVPPAPPAAVAVTPVPPSGDVVKIGEGVSATPVAPTEVATMDAASSPGGSACNDQTPQDFLVRKNFLREHGGNQRAIDYRNQTYGQYPAPGQPRATGRPASDSVIGTTFMSLPVRMHRKVVPALKCAEEEIKRTCGDHPYTARALAGVRSKNTYRGGEVTNHIYGIAIDVDPARNTCCGCVKPWNNAPRCQRPAKSEYDRMEMPECWVHAFERFGFYWLGHDVLQDTMHFEFLGDPDRIVRGAAPVSPPPAVPVSPPMPPAPRPADAAR